MPKHALLSKEDHAEAVSQGWTLCDTYDLSTKRVTRQLLPVHFKPPLAHAEAVSRLIVARARTGDKLALRALRSLMESNKP